VEVPDVALATLLRYRHGAAKVACPRHSQDGIKLGGPRTVSVRSGSGDSRIFWYCEHPGLFLRAANRDGSRSDAELDAVLRHSRRAAIGLDPDWQAFVHVFFDGIRKYRLR
jgi:hypothetical protein